MDLSAVKYSSVLTLIAVWSGSVATAVDNQLPLENNFTDEERLFRSVVQSQQERGSRFIRPVVNRRTIITVEYGVMLYSIIEVDAKNQQLMTKLWTVARWHNEFTSWNPDDYDQISKVFIPSNYLWIPDVILINSVSGLEDRTGLVVVEANGTCTIYDTIAFTSSCEINMVMFPFDQQNCTLVFASWSYDDEALVPIFLDGNEDIDTSSILVQSLEWDITSSGAYCTQQSDSIAMWHDLRFYVVIRRRPGFHVFVLVIPSLLLSILTPVLFCVPPTRPDRTSLGLSLFSSFFVLLLVLVQMLPSSASNSHLGMYYCFNMSLIALSTLISVAIIHVSSKPDTPEAVSRSAKVARILKFLSRPIGGNGGTRSCNRVDDAVNKTPAGNRNDRQGQTDRLDWRAVACAFDRICFLLSTFAVIIAIATLFPR